MAQDHDGRKYFVKPSVWESASSENIIVHIQNDIITIEWSPQEKEEYFDAEFQRSMRL